MSRKTLGPKAISLLRMPLWKVIYLGGTLRRPPAPGQCHTPVLDLRHHLMKGTK
jgi:hypothetical protein